MKTGLHTMLLLAIMSSLSCSKSTDSPQNKERKLEYIVSGNFSGSLFASYTTAGGGTQNELLEALPWSKEIVYSANVAAAIIALSGNGGVAGQQITVIVKRGGGQLSATTMTANATGSFTQTAPVVSF